MLSTLVECSYPAERRILSKNMLTIRLTRVGKKKDASFRVIVVESKRKVQPGNYLEMVGSYDPRIDTASLKADRIKYWISQGATLSDTVHNLLINQKIIEGKKINVLPKKTVPKPAPTEASGKEEPAAAAPAAEPKAEVPAEAPVAEAAPVDEPVAEEKPADTITE